MVESNSEVVTDPEGEKFCQILLGLLCDTKEIKIEIWRSRLASESHYFDIIFYNANLSCLFNDLSFKNFIKIKIEIDVTYDFYSI